MIEYSRKCYKCGRSPGLDANTKLFRFPKPGITNMLRCELWAKYCFPYGDWSSQEFQQTLYSAHKMLCDKHFKRTSFIDYPLSTNKLHRFAVPDDRDDKLPTDVETYMQCSKMGSVGKIGMKPDCLPSKFECQPDTRKLTTPPQPKSALNKRRHLEIIQNILSNETEPATSGVTASNRDSLRALHWFPNPKKDIVRFRTWVHAIGGEIIALGNENIYKLRRVCHTHFEEKYCCRNNKISNIAVPTLLMPGALLHLFSNPENPKEIERFQTWVMRIGGEIIGRDNWFIYKNRIICHKHFESQFIRRNDRISSCAMPTLHLIVNSL